MVNSVGFAKIADIFLCVVITFLMSNYILITCSENKLFSNYPFRIILVSDRYNGDSMELFVRYHIFDPIHIPLPFKWTLPIGVKITDC